MASKFYTDFFVKGGHVHVTGYDENSARTLEKYKIPTTFYSTRGYNQTKFVTLEGKPLYSLEFASIKDARETAKDIALYGNLKSEYTLINDLYPEIHQNIQLIKKVFLDIETTCENGFPDSNNPIEAVNCVTIVSDGIAYTAATGSYSPKHHNIKFKKCDSEEELFYTITSIMNRIKPDIISGWNVTGFDIPYLVCRSKVLFESLDWAKSISPWGDVKEETIEVWGKPTSTFVFSGITILDYLNVYKQYGKKQPNYRLDTVSESILGESKLKYDGSFQDFYKKDFDKFVDYNIQDTLLVYKMDQKLNYLSIIFMMAYMNKVRFQDTFMQIRMWETKIYNELYKKGIIAPAKVTTVNKESKFEGAFVADPIPGMYEWIATFDAKALYPSIMQALNISPETYVGKTNCTVKDMLDRKFVPTNNEVSYAANGAMFSKKSIGLIPGILKKLADDRDAAKGRMLEIERKLQIVKKELGKRKSKNGK